MKKQIFTRIIELKYHQVLLTKVKTDSEEAPVALRIETDIYFPEEDTYKRIGFNMGYAKQHEVDDAFGSLTMNGAIEIIDNMLLTAGIDENPYDNPEAKIIES